jgi:tetratricopeptide (TPR) repeat protein
MGASHLLWNTWFGFRLSAVMEREVGHVELLALYVLSGVAGACVSVIGQDVISAGASGAVFGLVGARYARWRLELGSLRAMLSHRRIRLDLFVVLLWCVLALTLGFDTYSYAGGLVFGALFGLALAHSQVRWWPVPVCVLLVVGLAVAAARPLPKVHTRYLAERAATDAMQKGEYQQVVALTAGTTDPKVLPLRIEALFILSRYEEALTVADAYVAAEPKEPQPLELRAHVRSVRGDLPGARADLDRVLELDARSVRAMFTRAELRWKQGETDAGISDAEAAVTLAPDALETQLTLIQLTARSGELQRALELCERAQRKLPLAFELEVQHASLQSALGRDEEALHTADTLLDREPASERAHVLRCYVLAAADEVEAARADCDAAVALDSNAEDARTIRGWVELEEGELDEAARDFAAALAARDTSGALAGRGFIALGREQLDAAAKDAEAALKLDAGDTEALLLSAEVALAKGDPELARARYAQALKWAPARWYEGRLASEGLRELVR